jgi:hypothetical protein
MDENIRSQLRLPPALHQELKMEAEKSGRSLNSEIVHRLMASLSMPAASSGGTQAAATSSGRVATTAAQLAAPENRAKLEQILGIILSAEQGGAGPRERG